MSLPFVALSYSTPAQAEQIVDYHINAKLDSNRRQIDGKLRLSWRNPSADSVPDLWFHLYLNAFKNNRSTFYKESGGQLRRDKMVEGKWGCIDITSLRLADGTDLTQHITFAHPDDNNADDQTVFRLELPKPVPPHERLEMDISFIAQLPEVFARTGYKRDFFMVGQWFPKIGVYEPAGMRGRSTGGWNCHQFHAHSEFYADYGHYLVEITVPSSFIVGATGKRTLKRANPDGTVTFTYEQDNVHDFAWTADPHFTELRRTFSAEGDVTLREYQTTADLLGRPVEEVKLSDVEIILLLQPTHLPQAERHFQAAKLGLKYFGLWYGRYPYPTLTVVDPAFGASGAGGMEYPTLITAGTSWLLNRWPLDRIRMPEMVTVHEFGHQFWYGLVGNNEFEEAWLDEGINSYSTGKVMEMGYGKEATLLEFLGLKLGESDMIRLLNQPQMKYEIIRQPSWKYLGGYSFFSYIKPEIALRTLENYLGEPTMARVMHAYFERYRFKHPCSNDFYNVAEEVSGQDLRWFFQQAMEDTKIMDYEVTDLVAEKTTEARGLFDYPDRGRVSLPIQDHQKKTDSSKENEAKGSYENRFTVRRSGDFVFPVEIEYKLEKMAPVRMRWDGKDRRVEYRFLSDTPLEWARVDPDHKNILDVDWLNNWRRVKHDQRAAMKWSFRWLFWIQNLLCLAGI